MAFSGISELQNIVVRDGMVLRPLVIGDADRILEILDADPSIRQNVGVAQRMTDKQAIADQIAIAESDEDIMRYSVIKAGRFIGLVSFWRLGDYITSFRDDARPEPDTYGFGYFLDPAERGQNIVPDAVTAVMAVARRTLNPKKFIAFCTDENTASQAVLKKCGFTRTDNVVYFPAEGWHEREYVIDVY